MKLNKMNIWLSWNDLGQLLEKKKRIYLFGKSEDLVPRTVAKLGNNYEIKILDNNKAYHNTTYLNKPILNPEILKEFKKEEDYVIITAEADAIIPEIESYKLRKLADFCCTPEFKDWGSLQTLKNNSTDLIFTSSDYFNLSKMRSSVLGGGVFFANVSENKYEKKIDGQYRQFIKKEEYFYVVEYVKKELHVFDKDFKILEKYELDQTKDKKEKPSYCGITHSKIMNSFFVTHPATDVISIYDEKNFKFLDKIIISTKSNEITGGQCCHTNDITILENSLFVSYFSKSGLWRKGVYDGGVYEINLKKDNKKVEIINGLNQPHSPEIIDGNICVLDSVGKNLFIGTRKASTFPGFVRGLDNDGTYYYIGQSEDMYTSRSFGETKDITMCNAGIYQYDNEKKITRFLATPNIMNIHDILVLK